MGKKILIVDDNQELLQVLKEFVRTAGFSVSVAKTGPEALAKARSFRPDLIVLDLVLPEMDGFAVCEAIRRNGELSKTPVIILTGLRSEFSRYAGFESGATDFVQKPISPGELVFKIRHCLETDDGGTSSSVGADARNGSRKA